MSAAEPRVLVFQHIAIEHPGVFRDFLREDGIGWTAVELDEGEPIPDLDAYGALWVMGGPMDVWEDDVHPWLVPERAAIREAVVERKMPFFGFCLGHQLLAQALGGEVGPAAAPEIGIMEVELTEAGRVSSIFQAWTTSIPACNGMVRKCCGHRPAPGFSPGRGTARSRRSALPIMPSASSTTSRSPGTPCATGARFPPTSRRSNVRWAKARWPNSRSTRRPAWPTSTAMRAGSTTTSCGSSGAAALGLRERRADGTRPVRVNGYGQCLSMSAAIARSSSFHSGFISKRVPPPVSVMVFGPISFAMSASRTLPVPTGSSNSIDIQGRWLSVHATTSLRMRVADAVRPPAIILSGVLSNSPCRARVHANPTGFVSQCGTLS